MGGEDSNTITLTPEVCRSALRDVREFFRLLEASPPEELAE
jgi:hypothetical protein